MAQSEALAVEDHNHPGHLGSLLLYDQLEQGEDTSEEVKEGNLQRTRNGKMLMGRPPVVATGPA